MGRLYESCTFSTERSSVAEREGVNSEPTQTYKARTCRPELCRSIRVLAYRVYTVSRKGSTSNL